MRFFSSLIALVLLLVQPVAASSGQRPRNEPAQPGVVDCLNNPARQPCLHPSHQHQHHPPPQPNIVVVPVPVVPAVTDHYGALAYDSASGQKGFAFDYGSPDLASERALNECGPRCVVIAEFMNGCAAYAMSERGQTGVGKAEAEDVAERIALSRCNAEGSNCTIRVWACNSPPKVVLYPTGAAPYSRCRRELYPGGVLPGECLGR